MEWSLSIIFKKKTVVFSLVGGILIPVGIYFGKGVKRVHQRASGSPLHIINTTTNHYIVSFRPFPLTLHQEINQDNKDLWTSVHSHFVCLEPTKIQPNFNPSEKRDEKEDISSGSEKWYRIKQQKKGCFFKSTLFET